MVKSVNEAFKLFMKNNINLDAEKVKQARESRDNLLMNLQEFDNEDFFHLCQNYNVHFGSFSRKTKCSPLDDIDLMIGLTADGATYNQFESWDNITIIASSLNDSQQNSINSDGTLNSTLVLNKFKKKLEKVREYQNSDLKRNGEAVVLNLISKDWSFDIVPCFHTVVENNGRAYDIIPNGNGKWKKTDPIIEQDRISKVNTKHNGRVLDTIRLVKYWNRRGKMPTIISYVLETMIVDYFESITDTPQLIEQRFRDVLYYIKDHIWTNIYDSKGIEGNINELDYFEKSKIQTRAFNDYNKTLNAISAELTDKDQEKAINIWGDIFGEEFPKYE